MNNPPFKRKLLSLIGRPANGRYLFVVLEHFKGTVYKPITARDMTDRENETLGDGKMKELHVPEIKNYEEEAAFWDNLDTADFMEDDEEWFRFETPSKRAIRIAILPEIVDELMQSAHSQGVSIETLANEILIERVRESVAAS